jgi:hypothetical protein
MTAIDPKRTLKGSWFRKRDAYSVGAGLPAKQALRWMAPAVPVFAGKLAPTMIAIRQNDSFGSEAVIDRPLSTHSGPSCRAAIGQKRPFVTGKNQPKVRFI